MKCHWIHTLTTNLLTLLVVHPKRGIEALDDIGVPGDYSGTIVEAGVDPTLIAERTRQAQADSAAAQQAIDNAPDMPDPLTEAEVLIALTALRELPARLDTADSELRADVYRSSASHSRTAVKREPSTSRFRRHSKAWTWRVGVGGGT